MKDGINAFIIMAMTFLPLSCVYSVFGFLDLGEVTYPEILKGVLMLIALIANIFWAKMWIGHPVIARLNRKSREHFNYDDDKSQSESI